MTAPRRAKPRTGSPSRPPSTPSSSHSQAHSEPSPEHPSPELGRPKIRHPRPRDPVRDPHRIPHPPGHPAVVAKARDTANRSRPRLPEPARGTPFWLLREIEAKRLDPATLSRDQRRSVLPFLLSGRHTTYQLAHMFQLSNTRMYQEVAAVRREIGEHVRTWDPETIVGYMTMAAERYTAMAVEQNDPGLAWSITKDFCTMLARLGLTGERESKLVMTFEAVGKGYEEAARKLAESMNPELSGEVVNALPLRTVAPLDHETPSRSYPASTTPDDD